MGYGNSCGESAVQALVSARARPFDHAVCMCKDAWADRLFSIRRLCSRRSVGTRHGDSGRRGVTCVWSLVAAKRPQSLSPCGAEWWGMALPPRRHNPGAGQALARATQTRRKTSHCHAEAALCGHTFCGGGDRAEEREELASYACWHTTLHKTSFCRGRLAAAGITWPAT